MKKKFSGRDKLISIKLKNFWREFDNLQMKNNETVLRILLQSFSNIQLNQKPWRCYKLSKNCGKDLEKLAIKIKHVVAVSLL